MKLFVSRTLAISLLSLFVVTGMAFAQGDGTQGTGLSNPLAADTIPELLENIVRFLRNIAAPIVAIMIIVGAFQILFAAGDPEKFKKGKDTILYTVIGYAIIWIGWGITSIIEDILSGGAV